MSSIQPVPSDIIVLLIKSLPGIPSEVELYNFARSIEILHGIGLDSPTLPESAPPRFI